MPDFTEASDLTGTEFRELGMSLANQLPGEAMTAMRLTTGLRLIRNRCWCIETKSHARWPTANATIAKNAAKKSPPLLSAPQRIGEPERRWNEWVPRTLTYFFLPYGSSSLNSLLSTYTFVDDSILPENGYAFVSITG